MKKSISFNQFKEACKQNEFNLIPHGNGMKCKNPYNGSMTDGPNCHSLCEQQHCPYWRNLDTISERSHHEDLMWAGLSNRMDVLIAKDHLTYGEVEIYKTLKTYQDAKNFLEEKENIWLNK